MWVAGKNNRVLGSGPQREQLHELQGVPHGMCLSRAAPNTPLMGSGGGGFHPGLHKKWQWRAAGSNVIAIRQEVYLGAVLVHSSTSPLPWAPLLQLFGGAEAPLGTLALQAADVGKHFSALLRDEHQVRLQVMNPPGSGLMPWNTSPTAPQPGSERAKWFLGRTDLTAHSAREIWG